MSYISLIQVQKTNYGCIELSFISSFLKRYSHNVKYFILKQKNLFENANYLKSQYFIFVTSECEGNFEGISNAINFTRIKNPDAVFIVAGPMATLHSDEALRYTGAHYIIKGSAVPTVQSIVENSTNPAEIKPGIIHSVNEYNIDLLQIDPEAYPDNSLRRYNLVQTLGCNYARCNFCPLKLMYLGVKVRPVHNVINDMKNLALRKNAESFMFRDQNFLANPKRFFELNSSMDAEGLKQKIIFAARADSIIKSLHYLEMYANRIENVQIGIESFLDIQLERYNKGVLAYQNYQAVNSLIKLGIPTYIFLIIADNKSTIEELLEVSNIFKVNPHFVLLLASARLRYYHEYENEKGEYEDYMKLCQKALEGIAALNVSPLMSGTLKRFFEEKQISENSKKVIAEWFDDLNNLILQLKCRIIDYDSGIAKVNEMSQEIASVLQTLYKER